MVERSVLTYYIDGDVCIEKEFFEECRTRSWVNTYQVKNKFGNGTSS